MPSVPNKERLIGAFLARLSSSLIKSLPNKTSRNSRRLQFFLKFSILVIYAWTSGLRVIPTDVYRTAEQQNERYKKGRTLPGPIVTNCDGYNNLSRHQKWEAGDLLILFHRNNAYISVWSPFMAYVPLGGFWERLGGTWGGRWSTPCDPNHFQL